MLIKIRGWRIEEASMRKALSFINKALNVLLGRNVTLPVDVVLRCYPSLRFMY